jgi:alkylated DNA repair dioxygenase AlkB
MRYNPIVGFGGKFTFLAISAVLLSSPPLRAQGNPDLQARVAELKESSAKNKQALAQYTWKETVQIYLKGDLKKTENFQVKQGPDGKPVKTSLDTPAAPQQPSGRGGRLKEHVVEKKKEEYKDYADQMKELAQHYVPPDKDDIQAAYAKGNIELVGGGSVPDQVKLVIHNYYKQGDSVTLTIDKAKKQLQAIAIASYMDDPKDVMNLTVTFDRLPDGTNHVASTTIDGVSKQLKVNTTNSDYQHL